MQDTQPTDSILNFASSAGDFKRAPGTDEERAARLSRMMSAQCTLEPPETVGLRTGWKPSASGFGVTPDGSVPNTFGGAPSPHPTHSTLANSQRHATCQEHTRAPYPAAAAEC